MLGLPFLAPRDPVEKRDDGRRVSRLARWEETEETMTGFFVLFGGILFLAIVITILDGLTWREDKHNSRPR